MYGSKPDEMTDELLASKLRIPFDLLTDDLSSSILAIVIACMSIAFLEWLVLRQGYGILCVPFWGHDLVLFLVSKQV